MARSKVHAPFVDLIWMEIGTPDLKLAQKFSESVIPARTRGWRMIACHRCNWKQHIDDSTIAKFQKDLVAM
ncbi:hypothetical protein [Mycobacterium lepromatosis]|uniref:hypothetical protein n=1 Tax=Mycobacterium lepromatosis TaxID=480418 RepID=UPI003D0675AC